MQKVIPLESVVEAWNKATSFDEFCSTLIVDSQRGKVLIGRVRNKRIKIQDKPRSFWNGDNYLIDENYQPNGCGTPTGAVPGSIEKINAMRRRLELKQELWHPGDAVDHISIRQCIKRMSE